jgi:hypothetical protein
MTTFKSQVQKRELLDPSWLLSGHIFKGPTLDNLVKNRITTTLTILVLLIFIFGAGLIFLYRNMRREIHLFPIQIRIRVQRVARNKDTLVAHWYVC